MNTAPDQHFLATAINCAYQTVKSFPDFAEFLYLMLSAVDEDLYE